MNSPTEWIECNLPWKDFEEADSFTERGLNIAGTLIEVEWKGKKRIYLIGDMNINTGTCDCCHLFPSAAIITRYKRVWKA